MILSHKHRFIYIKTYKTASTSIEAALSEICGPDDVVTPASEPLMRHRKGQRAQNYRLDHPLVPKRPLLKRLLMRPERRYHPSVGYYEHMPAWRVRAYAGEDVWNAYYKFSFERNPWERQVSWFRYKTKSKASPGSFKAFNADKSRAYVENYDLYSIEDEICLDFVGRYETLDRDFAEVLKVVGLSGQVDLGHVNKSEDREKRDYRAMYDEALKETMARWYAREIRHFGYGF